MHRRSTIYSCLISENCLILKILVTSIQHSYIRQGESAAGHTMWKVSYGKIFQLKSLINNRNEHI